MNLRDGSVHHVGEEGTQKLIDSLIHNTTVEKLVLHEKYKSIANSEIRKRARE